MSSPVSQDSATNIEPSTNAPNARAQALAERLERGAQALASFAIGLTEAEWQTRLSRDGRKIGVVVHHVASVYPVEIELAQTIADGKPVTGVVSQTIDDMSCRSWTNSISVSGTASSSLSLSDSITSSALRSR